MERKDNCDITVQRGDNKIKLTKRCREVRMTAREDDAESGREQDKML